MIRSQTLSSNPDLAIVTNDLGEYVIAENGIDFAAIHKSHPRYQDFEARGFIESGGPKGGLADMARRTRKAFMREGPSLHIFVVSLRCDHSCQYCQVSRAALNAAGKDMSRADAMSALDRVFESDASALTIEFQGGEPALRFDLIQEIVEAAEARQEQDGRPLRFTMATTLHLLSDLDLDFCKQHRIHLSTSLDGPEAIHSAQRPIPTRDSWRRTVDGIERARAVLGHDGVVALPTVTRPMLVNPEALVTTYAELGFGAIFLRPLAPYGFAARTRRALGYSVPEFMSFYRRALTEVLRLNQSGTDMQEVMAAIMLRHIFTPFHSGYMDLRSPAGAGLGLMVYNYDGGVYPSDEARMAAETGDERFRLGSVGDPLDQLLTSPPMRWLARGAVAEVLPDCSTCAFVPYCGADPVHHAIVHGDPAAARLGTDFCDRNTALFQLLFGMIAERDPETMRTFVSWATGASRAGMRPGWIEQ